MKHSIKKTNRTTLDATILFADMVDSSTLSHILDPQMYDEIVSQFQEAAASVVLETITEERKRLIEHIEASVRGDELCLILGGYRQEMSAERHYGGMDLSAWIALQVAIRLKRRWLLVPKNVERITAGQPPLGIAIGIHSGPVIVADHARFIYGQLTTTSQLTAEGYAINTAKRVETASRSGKYSRIYLTRPIYNRTPADFRQAFVPTDFPQLKGLPHAPIIYEAKGFGHFDDKSFPKSPEFAHPAPLGIYEMVVKANPHEIWLQLDLAHKLFDEGDYRNAARKYKEIIEVDPIFAPAYSYWGRALLRELFTDEAREPLERAVELNPDQARANHFLAVCLRRIALMALHKEKQPGKAKDLFERAIRFHDKAQRIVKLEDMDYPWAENGFLYTIAHCEPIAQEMVPFRLRPALERAEKLYDSIRSAPEWSSKVHLVFHTMGFILFQLGEYGEAQRCFKRALRNLRFRRDMDTKGLGEKRSEILFHLGLSHWRVGRRPERERAERYWREAKQMIFEAWRGEGDRAWRGLYWSYWLLSELGRDVDSPA